MTFLSAVESRKKFNTLALIVATAAGSILNSAPSKAASSLVFTPIGVPAGTQKVTLPPVGANPGQNTPVQLNMTGNIFTVPQPPPPSSNTGSTRKFDFRGLTPSTGSGIFTGVTGIQWTGNPGNPNILRADYYAPQAGTCTSQDISTGGQCKWSNMAMVLRPFYLLGDSTCVICGISNLVSVPTPAEQNGTYFSSSNGTRTVIPGNQLITDSVRSSTTSIVFGSSGIQADVSMDAFDSFLINQASENILTGGSIIFTEKVPSPLPILGSTVAFSFSRKLRKRIKQSQSLG